jgi:hypothetical protein
VSDALGKVAGLIADVTDAEAGEILSRLGVATESQPVRREPPPLPATRAGGRISSEVEWV